MAKIMQMDVLADIHAHFLKGQTDGLPFQQVLGDLKNTLATKGWWGLKDVIDPLTGDTQTVNIGAWRLRRAYNFNLRTAHAEGQWARTQESKDAFPYVIYDACNSAENRPDHCAWDGLVFPVDSAWVKRHIPPPKEPGCKCRYRTLTAGEVQRRGLTVRPGEDETYIKVNGEVRAVPERYTEWQNPRTGKKMRLPMGVHPMFAAPPGGWYTHLEEYARELLSTLPESIAAAIIATWENADEIPSGNG
jgi:uncharacterized protein with gpF-like domain